MNFMAPLQIWARATGPLASSTQYGSNHITQILITNENGIIGIPLRGFSVSSIIVLEIITFKI